MVPQCLQASETGLDFLNALTRTRLKTGVPALDALRRSRGAPGLRTGDLVELHGGGVGGAGGGRQAVFRKATAMFSLPRDCAGHESTVLYFTMDGTFDAALLREDMHRCVTSFRHGACHRQQQQEEQVSEHQYQQRQYEYRRDDEAVVEASLRRVIVLTCTDAADVQFALLYAEGLLSSPESNVKLLVFDNIAANFFEHRAAAVALAHTQDGRHTRAKHSWTTSFGSKFAQKLDHLRRAHHVVILTFTPTYFDSSSSGSAHLLGSKWNAIRKHRIKV